MYSYSHLLWCFISATESHYKVLSYILVLIENVTVNVNAFCEHMICRQANYEAFVDVL